MRRHEAKTGENGGNAGARGRERKRKQSARRKGTGIEWTDETWNVVTGCTKVSPGCDHCYAERWFPRVYPKRSFEDVRMHEDRLGWPEEMWTRPAKIFVCSMGDLFHDAVSGAFLDRVFRVMERTPQHCYQVLTKRSGRVRSYLRKRWDGITPPEHIWIGVSVEDRERVVRVRHLRETPARVRFLSCEPLLEDLKLEPEDVQGVHWIIAGGESGPQWRACPPDAVRALRELCSSTGIAFFFKQWAGLYPKRLGRELDGKHHDAYPVTRSTP